MKNFSNLLFGILIGISMCGFISCSGGSKDSRLTQEQEDSITLGEVNDLLSDYDSAPSESGAIIAAQRFIRDKFASNAEFEDEGTIVEETSVPGRFKVLQKFTAEDHPSNWTKFIYRIWVQRFDDGSWEFGNLGVESVTGEKVFSTEGNMKEREQGEGVGDNLTVAGISFKIAEKKPDAIRIYTPKKLSMAQLRDVTKELMNQYSTIQYATDAKHERGDEYASWTGGIFCDMDNNEVLSKEKFFK